MNNKGGQLRLHSHSRAKALEQAEKGTQCGSLDKSFLYFRNVSSPSPPWTNHILNVKAEKKNHPMNGLFLFKALSGTRRKNKGRRVHDHLRAIKSTLNDIAVASPPFFVCVCVVNEDGDEQHKHTWMNKSVALLLLCHNTSTLSSLNCVRCDESTHNFGGRRDGGEEGKGRGQGRNQGGAPSLSHSHCLPELFHVHIHAYRVPLIIVRLAFEQGEMDAYMHWVAVKLKATSALVMRRRESLEDNSGPHYYEPDL